MSSAFSFEHHWGIVHLGSRWQCIVLVGKNSFSLQIRFLKKSKMFSESCARPLPGAQAPSCFPCLLQGSLELGPRLPSAALGARPRTAPTWELPPLGPCVFVSSSTVTKGHKLSDFSSVPQTCPAVHDLMGYSQPGSSVCGILQAKILEWVAIPFSRGST